jgi:two-component system LytT family response regulator
MTPRNLTAVIADDESLARDVISHYLKHHPYISVVAACKDGLEAVNTILRLKPDLVFLDIQMPEIDGFAVVQSLKKEDFLPMIIFITAHEQFAVKAFEVSAVDYLLKPFEQDRFDLAIQKALKFENQENGLEERIGRLLHSYETMVNATKAEQHSYLQKILIKEPRRLFFVSTSDIYFFEAAGDYAMVHTADKKFLVQESMNALEQKLDPGFFTRIHRSTIINTAYIRELQPHYNGEFHVVMQNGAIVKMSRTYREQAKKIFGGA